MSEQTPICIWNRGSDQYYWAPKYIIAEDIDPDVPSGPHSCYAEVLDNIGDFMNCDRHAVPQNWKPLLGEIPERMRGKF